MILYAGYEDNEGRFVGDQGNVDFTKVNKQACRAALKCVHFAVLREIGMGEQANSI